MTKLACFTAFQPKTVTIESLCHCPARGLVFQGLSDGSIQLLNADTLASVGAIPANQLRSVRTMLLHGDLLLTSGVHGSVSMWDLSALTEICTLESSQGAIWDMVLGNDDKLYLATETGSIVVVSLRGHEDMCIDSVWKVNKGVRALSLCVSGKYVFVGDASGTISRWSLGVCDSTFVIPSKNDNPVLIWALSSLGNGKIVSGDSMGSCSVWDVDSCTLVSSFQDHQADVLTVYTHNNKMYTSGVDARIVTYALPDVCLESTTTIVPRDVCAILHTGKHLLVGGAEGRLGVANTGKSDRFPGGSVQVLPHRILCKSEDRAIHVYKSDGTFLALLTEHEPIAAFCGNETDNVALATVGGVVRILAVGGDEIKVAHTVSVPGLVACMGMNETSLIVVSTAGSVSTVHLRTGKFKQIEGSALDPKSVHWTSSSEFCVVSFNGQVTRGSLKSAMLPAKSLLADSVKITASCVLNGEVIFATSDLQIYTNGKFRSIPKSCKLKPLQFVSEIISVENALLLIGESFVVSMPTEGAPKSHPTAPMGGLVVGAGTCDGHPLLVLAEFKRVQAQLVAPFERKSFQE